MAPLLETLPLPCFAVDRIKPLPAVLQTLKGRPLITLENAAKQAGFGSAIAEVHDAPVLILGWEDAFIPQGSDAELRRFGRLDTEALRATISTFLQEHAE